MPFLRTLSNMKEVQETNRTAVLRVLFANSPMSRIEIAEATGLSTPTISRIVKELIQEKLVIEVGKVEMMQGRNRDLLQIDYDHHFILGFEVNESYVHGVLCNLRGEIKMSLAREITSKKPKDVAAHIAEILSLIQNQVSKSNRVLGIGLSVSGVVSPEEQKIIYSDTMKWKGIHVQELFPPLDDLMLVVENDANAAILGELWLGHVSEYENLVYIQIGAGVIGASLFINGDLVRGSQYIAGELSHFPIAQNGKPCTCGKSGCLQTCVSLERLEKEFENLSGKRGLIQAYKMGDPLASQFVDDVIEKLSILIRFLVYLVNPEAIILGGVWTEAGESFLEDLRKRVSEDPALRDDSIPQVVFSSLHPHAGAMGAAGLVLDEFFRYQ